jgi:hypothetical protein
VDGHPLDGSAEAFGDSAVRTALFHHDRPDGLELMLGSYRTDFQRRLHIARILRSLATGWAAKLTRTRTRLAQVPASLVLLALHAGTGGVGQWKTTLLEPSYLHQRAHTSTADVLAIGLSLFRKRY